MPTLRHPPLRRVAGVAAAALAACALPGTAAAVDLHAAVSGSAGADSFSVHPGVDPATVRVDLDAGGPFSASGGCVQDSAVRAYCTVGDDGLRIELGGGDDRLDVAPESALGFPLLADGGDGNDMLTGAAGAETLLGGHGDDALDGRDGSDRLDGGPGLDQLDGSAGADQVLGGDGDDRLVGDGLFAPAADLLDGGSGRDTVEDWSPAGAGQRGLLTVGVDDGPGDGFAGEGDELRAVEVLRITSPGAIAGSEGADEITVVNGPTRVSGRGGDDLLYGGVDGDALDGGAGADRLAGGPGDDTLVGGPGADQLSGDGAQSSRFGNDAIDAVDGEPDSVDCGLGSDRVRADVVDTVAGDCETVERVGEPGPPQPRGGGRDQPRTRGTPPSRALALKLAGRAPRLAAALRRGLAVRVAGAARGTTVRLQARISARTARAAGLGRGARVVASGSARVRGAAGTATVRLTFAPAARAKLARLRTLPLTIAAAGSKRGATVTLRR